MGSRDAKAYLASPEVVAASALSGIITGPGIYQVPENWTGVDAGYGTGLPRTPETELSGLVQQLDSFIDRVESAVAPAEDKPATEILPGFPSRISGEIVFCDADNLDTDAIYPGKLTYQDNVSRADMARACFSNYDPSFDGIAQPGDIIVSGFNFGCGSSREQSATAILARDIPLVVAASFGNVFSRNSINNALMGLEIPKVVERLRARFPVKGGEGRVLTRRTGWTLTWDVRRSLVEVTEGPGGETWTEKVGELPANVQEIIAAGGLEAWVKAELAKTA
jgi:homoaconitate hydratase